MLLVRILTKVINPTKLRVKTTGHYAIEHHVNGMHTVELHPGLTKCLTYAMSSYIVRSMVTACMFDFTFHLSW